MGLISSAQTVCQACPGWSVCIPQCGQFTACLGRGVRFPLWMVSPDITTWVAVMQRWNWEKPQGRGPSGFFFPFFFFFFFSLFFLYLIGPVFGDFWQETSFSYMVSFLWLQKECGVEAPPGQLFLLGSLFTDTSCTYGMWRTLEFSPEENEDEIKMKHLRHKYNLCITLNRLYCIDMKKKKNPYINVLHVHS